MNAVPEQFWIVAPVPRAVPVMGVSPTRIRVHLDGDSAELDREAFVEHGRIVAPQVADARPVPLLAVTEAEARSRGAALDRASAAALDERIAALKDERARLDDELTRAKKERKRRRAVGPA